MIKYTLDKTLKELDLTRNKLSVMANVRSNTIIDMVDGKIRRMDIDTLDSVIRVLNELAREKGMEKRFGIEDVMVYVDES